jgi:hypothetical protein
MLSVGSCNVFRIDNLVLQVSGSTEVYTENKNHRIL